MLEITNPLGLIAFASVPAVLFLHFFRTRFKRHVVPALFLWEQEREKSPEGAKFTKIQKSVSLLLELLAAVLLSVLMSGISCASRSQYSHTIIILDDSLSMKARDNIGYFYKKALDKVKETISKGGKRALFTVIKACKHPTIIAGPFAPATEVLSLVKEWEPGSYTSNISGTLEFAGQFRDSAHEIIYITDHVPEEYAGYVRIISVGNPVPNAGIVSASRSHDLLGGENIFLAVRNFSDLSLSIGVTFTAGNRQIAVKNITIGADKSEQLSFSLLSTPYSIGIKLQDDNFADDNTAVLLPEHRKTVKVFKGIEGEDLGVGKLLRIIPDVEQCTKASDSHLAIMPAGSGLSHEEDRWVVEIGSRGNSRVNISQGYLFDRKNPLLRGITLDGVIWGGAGKVADDDIAKGLMPLITAGSHFLVYGQEDEKFFCINIDPGKTNFFKSVDWPLLFSNFVEARRKFLPGLKRANYILGEDIVYKSPGRIKGEKGVLSRNGKKLKEMMISGMNILKDTGLCGVYELKVHGKTEARFSVNFMNPLESDFRRMKEADIKGKHASRKETMQKRVKWFDPLLLMLVAACLIGDWYVLQRR